MPRVTFEPSGVSTDLRDGESVLELRLVCPDGSHRALDDVVYLRGGRVLAAPFDIDRLDWTGEPVPILEGVWSRPEHGTGHLALSGNGTLAYVPPTEARSRLVWVDRAGSVQPISENRGDFEDPRLSPDGRKLSLSIRESGKFHVGMSAQTPTGCR